MKPIKSATAEKAGAKIKEVGRQLADQSASAAENGKKEVVHFLEERKEEVAGGVRDLDQALRRTAQEVEHDGMSRVIESVAGGVDRLAKTLETTELDDALLALERVSRQNTTLFVAGSFALGLAAARFVRSSARHTSYSTATLAGHTTH